MIIAIMTAVLVSGGTYLVLQRGMLRIIIGMIPISHVTNLIILSMGVSARRDKPLLGNEVTAGVGAAEQMVDPSSQAFVLTAIMITMAVTAFMLALTGLGHDGDTRIYEDREVMWQLSTAGCRVGRSVPTDSDSTVIGIPGVFSVPDKFPRETPFGDDEK